MSGLESALTKMCMLPVPRSKARRPESRMASNTSMRATATATRAIVVMVENNRVVSERRTMVRSVRAMATTEYGCSGGGAGLSLNMLNPTSGVPTGPSKPTAKRTWKRSLVRLLIIGVATWSLCGCALVSMQERIIFPREVPGSRDADMPIPADWEQVTVAAGDGTIIPAWLKLPPVKIAAASPNQERFPLVVFFHGNAEVIDDIANGDPSVAIYRPWGYAVLLLEYRGYGRAYDAAGGPTQKGIVQDSIKLIDIVTARADIDAKRIIFYGRSLGGGVACAVAEQRPPSAMILQSTFKSVTSMAARYFIPAVFIRHRFDNEKFLRTFNAPVLLLHGSNDDIVSCAHSESLVKTSPHARLVKQACGHNDFPADFNAYQREIKAFLDALPPVRRP